MLLYIDYGFVVVDDLLHIGDLRHEMGETCFTIVVGVDLLRFFKGDIALGIGCDEDASCESAALGYEKHSAFVAWAKFLYRLIYLQKMLMGKCLVYRDIVISP